MEGWGTGLLCYLRMSEPCLHSLSASHACVLPHLIKAHTHPLCRILPALTPKRQTLEMPMRTQSCGPRMLMHLESIVAPTPPPRSLKESRSLLTRMQPSSPQSHMQVENTAVSFSGKRQSLPIPRMQPNSPPALTQSPSLTQVESTAMSFSGKRLSSLVMTRMPPNSLSSPSLMQVESSPSHRRRKSLLSLQPTSPETLMQIEGTGLFAPSPPQSERSSLNVAGRHSLNVSMRTQSCNGQMPMRVESSTVASSPSHRRRRSLEVPSRFSGPITLQLLMQAETKQPAAPPSPHKVGYMHGSVCACLCAHMLAAEGNQQNVLTA